MGKVASNENVNLPPLHLQEYDKLQNEISQTLAEIGSLERFSLLSSGGIFAWLLTYDKPVTYPIAFFLPAILTFLFGLITWGHFNRIKLIARYVREKYEVRMNSKADQLTGFGWETYLSGKLGKWGSVLANGRILMWILHLAGTVVLAIWLINGTPDHGCKN